MFVNFSYYHMHFMEKWSHCKYKIKEFYREKCICTNIVIYFFSYQVRGDSEGNLNIWDVRTKSSRNITTKRGFVKKIRFAPGRGNMKLLVLHVDSVSIWDVKEAEIINELRSPKDLVSKPTDIGNWFHNFASPLLVYY